MDGVAEASRLITNIYEAVRSGGLSFAVGGSAAMAAALKYLVACIVAIFVCYKVWQLLSPDEGGAIKPAMIVGPIVRCVLVVTFCLNAAVYNGWVIQTAHHGVDDVVRVASGKANVRSATELVDRGLTETMIAAQRYKVQGAGWLPGNQAVWWFTGFVVMLFGWVITGLSGMLMLVASIGLDLGLAVGPWFLMFAAHEATARIALAFLNQIMGYVVQFMFYGAGLALMGPLWLQALKMSEANPKDGLSTFAPAFIVGMGLVILFLHLGRKAEGLTGGIGVSTMGGMSFMQRMAGTGLRGVGAMRPGELARSGGKLMRDVQALGLHKDMATIGALLRGRRI